jgi:polyhydroxyalkanoate synthesis regulator protein
LSNTIFIFDCLSKQIEDFKHRRGEWAQKQSTSEKVKRQFADLLDDKPDAKQPKAKAKKQSQPQQSDDIDEMFDSLPSSKRQKA